MSKTHNSKYKHGRHEITKHSNYDEKDLASSYHDHHKRKKKHKRHQCRTDRRSGDDLSYTSRNGHQDENKLRHSEGGNVIEVHGSSSEQESDDRESSNSNIKVRKHLRHGDYHKDRSHKEKKHRKRPRSESDSSSESNEDEEESENDDEEDEDEREEAEDMSRKHKHHFKKQLKNKRKVPDSQNDENSMNHNDKHRETSRSTSNERIDSKNKKIIKERDVENDRNHRRDAVRTESVKVKVEPVERRIKKEHGASNPESNESEGRAGQGSSNTNRGRRSGGTSRDKDDHEWGGNSRNAGSNSKSNSKAPAGDKQKPSFALSGKLAEDTNTYNGVVIKYSEPQEARMPKKRWRLYPFKGDQGLPTLYIHRQSAYLMGRDRKVVDIAIDHPSCSKQHAALQYRLITYNRANGTVGKQVRLYIIDLESANGTFINNKKIEPRKYVELMEKDVLKFGFSSREYVLLHEHSKSDDEDA